MGFPFNSSSTLFPPPHLNDNSSTNFYSVYYNESNFTHHISASAKHTVTTTISFLPLGLGILLISLSGIIANILSAIVLLRPSMRSTYTRITLGLTFCDTVYLLTKLLRYGLQSMFTEFSVAFGYTHIFYPKAGNCLRALTCIAHTGFTYFTMAVAADRYFVVCWPHRSRHTWTIKRANYLVAAVIIFSVLYNFTRWWEFEYKMLTETDECNQTMVYYKMEPTAFRMNPNYRKPYKLTYLFVMNIIPFLSLTFLNSAIWRAMRISTRRKESQTSRQRQDKSFALMLIYVVAVFLISSSIYLVRDVVAFFGIKFSPVWDNLGNFLLTLNSGINFVLYCAFGTKFRHEFVKVYREYLNSCYACVTMSPQMELSTLSTKEVSYVSSAK